MKIIRNNLIPFKGFSAINLFGVLFARKNAHISQRTIRHEEIHTAQMKELLYVFFYLLYILNWVVNLFCYEEAYRNIVFEREAYENDDDVNYLKTRKRFNWINL